METFATLIMVVVIWLWGVLTGYWFGYVDGYLQKAQEVMDGWRSSRDED